MKRTPDAPILAAKEMTELEVLLGHRFVDRRLLLTALTHKSIGAEDNQRLEFLGDSVLGLVVAERIYECYGDFDEGRMTQIRAQVIRESTLCEVIRRSGISRYLFLAKGEEQTGGRDRSSNLADLFEALTAAIYLDGGIEEARRFVLGHLQEFIELSVRGQLISDYKSTLQERVQRTPGLSIEYRLEETSGEDHSKVFRTSVSIGGIAYGYGSGRTKKQSEQEAAKQALEKFGSPDHVSQEG